ncbi:MAG: F-type H+-transporting ATPase subunit delta [Rhodothermales bacterium]|jgi:F-type H+-transporting ATPase subunit delta
MNGSVAKRYAKAVFSLALERELLASVAEDLTSIAKLLAESEDFGGFFTDPTIEPFDRHQGIDALLKGKASELTLQFLHFLVDKTRIVTLPEICAAFEAMHDDYMGIQKVRVVSARPLADEQVESLKARLSKRFDRSIEAKLEVDEDLIAGFIVIAGDSVLDYSIKTQLAGVRQRIING